MRKHKFVLILICSTLLPSELLFGQTDSARQTIAMELHETPEVSKMTGFGNCQWLFPLDEPNETLLAQPDYKSDRLYYYAAKYGDADDKIHTLVLDESQGTATGYDTVYVDLNNDNRIEAETEKFSFELGSTRQATPLRIKLTVSAGGKKIPYYFSFTAFPYNDERYPGNKIHANARNSSIFVGKANFGGKQCKIAIADLNSNGLFNDVEQGIFRGDRFFVDLNGDGKFKHSSRYSQQEEGFPYGRYTRIAGKWYSVEAAPDGTTIQIAPAQPQLATVSAQETIEMVALYSDKQSQSLHFSGGSAQGIVGTYSLAIVVLSTADDDGRTWNCTGSFRSDRPQVTVATGTETQIDKVFPLRVSIEPVGKTPSEIVMLKPTVTGATGGSYGFPRISRPEGSFEIQDRQGKVIDSGKFKYG